MFALGAVGFLVGQSVLQASIGCSSGFGLLNPNSLCGEITHERSEWDFEPLRQKLSRMVEETGLLGKVPHIAVHFRDLRNGPRFSIREYENFVPASLLKLPVMMVLLHEADRHPELLDERITFTGKRSEGSSTDEPDQALEPGTEYTVRDLMERMIRYSDNDASHLLVDKINAAGLQANSNTFSDLGTMKLMMNATLDNTRLISLVNVFVALYNHAYLSDINSQYALEMLSGTTFRNGIVAGVPEGVMVAHKYGIHVAEGEQTELHDCGIVYHRTAPYVLCVLTAGADVDTASSAIRDISRAVYEEVDALD